MSDTSYHYIDGIAEFTMVKKPNEYGNFTVRLAMNDEQFENYQKIGLGLTPKDSENGKAVYFRRPNTKLIKNELVELGPPEVVDADGNPFEELIGKGSEVCVKINKYPTVKGPGHTLLAVQVKKLVPVERTGEYRNF